MDESAERLLAVCGSVRCIAARRAGSDGHRRDLAAEAFCQQATLKNSQFELLLKLSECRGDTRRAPVGLAATRSKPMRAGKEAL